MLDYEDFRHRVRHDQQLDSLGTVLHTCYRRRYYRTLGHVQVMPTCYASQCLIRHPRSHWRVPSQSSSSDRSYTIHTILSDRFLLCCVPAPGLSRPWKYHPPFPSRATPSSHYQFSTSGQKATEIVLQLMPSFSVASCVSMRPGPSTRANVDKLASRSPTGRRCGTDI